MSREKAPNKAFDLPVVVEEQEGVVAVPTTKDSGTSTKISEQNELESKPDGPVLSLKPRTKSLKVSPFLSSSVVLRVIVVDGALFNAIHPGV